MDRGGTRGLLLSRSAAASAPAATSAAVLVRPRREYSVCLPRRANTKAAYRFLSNGRVDEGAILAGQATQTRFAATTTPVLILHDSTGFTFARQDRAPVGMTHKSFMRRGKKGRPLQSVICGILMHSSLAVTPEGLPLGLAAVKFWSRSTF